MTILERQLLEKLRILSEEKQQEVLDFVEFLIAKNADQNRSAESESLKNESFRDFFGVLKGSPNFNDDPVAIQREMRSEWD